MNRIIRIIRTLAVLPFLLLAACEKRASGPLPQEIYVWQRDWTPAVQEAVRETSEFARVVVLAAEVNLRDDLPRIFRVPLDAAALKASGRPVGAAVRVSAFPTRFADDPKRADAVRRTVRDVLAEARAKGIPLAEIQIDYDCPESKLADYRTFLSSLRAETGKTPLVITALPTWTGRRQDFRDLINAADGYVLQVHSVTQPKGRGTELVLCDPETAIWWVDQVARFRKPFRVALPTYSYLLIFNEEGKLLGVSAEGSLFSVPEGARLRRVNSDPEAMAGLIQSWTRDRPEQLAGILWYRLPVEGDRMNWSRSTLKAVMAGRTPAAEVRAARREPEPGLVEIDLVNSGEAEAPSPALVRVRWKGAAPIAADGLSVYQLVKGPGEIRLEGSGGGVLRPGERRTIAWLRFADRTEVSLELPKKPG